MVQHPGPGHPAVYRLLSLCTAALLWAGCAKEGFPPGGPEDRTPPRIIAVSPDDGTTGADTVREISVEFSENVDRRSAEEAFYVMPPLPGGLSFSWHGTRMTAVLPAPPAPGRTYIITVGAAVADRRGNTMERSFLSAFATGDSLDRNGIRGRVRDAGFAGHAAVVWALHPDSITGLVPAGGPAYITQSGTDGRFAFRYMAAGTYRLLAFDDRNRDGKPAVGRERMGGTDRDVAAHPDTGTYDAEVVLADADTVAPVPVRAVLRGTRQVEVAFTTPLAAGPGDGAVTVTVAGTTVAAGALLTGVPDEYSLSAVTPVPVAAETCTVAVSGVTAVHGTPMDGRYRIPAYAEPGDTGRPALSSVLPRRGARGVHPGAPVELTFSMPMDAAGIPAMTVTDTARGSAVPYTAEWRNRTVLRVRPDSSLAGRTCYRVALPLNEALALNGRTGADTVVTFRFTTAPDDTLGGLAGRVTGAPAEAPVRVVLRRTGGTADREFTAVADADGAFIFPRLLPGRYDLHAFADTDGDGRHTPARLRPFRFMEPLAVGTGPVTVRPLWDTENILLPFPGGR